MATKSNKIIYINLIAYPVETLGPSKRVGLWFQGCSLGCKGCVSKHTWQIDNSYKQNIKDIEKKLKNYKCKNLTISGGEPFEQADALYTLLKNIRDYFNDILIYSGYEYKYLNKHYAKILDLIDVLIDGRFIKTNLSSKAYKGSKNQKMYIFNEGLVEKYKSFFNMPKTELQIYSDSKKLYFLGIPKIDNNTLKRIYNEV